MKKTALSAALLLVTGVATAAPITNFELTGGTFSMDGANYFSISPGEFANATIGGYNGGARAGTSLALNSIGYFTFGTFGPVLISTRADVGGVAYRPLTGDVTNGNLTLDLDAWTAWYAGTFFNQGTNTTCVVADFIAVFPGDENCSGGAAVTTYDAATGAFTATWTSVVVGGSFNNNVGAWSITGNITNPEVNPIPVPAAAWLFGSGLLGLAGIARRRKAA